MRRSGIIVLAVCGLLAITTAVSAADTKASAPRPPQKAAPTPALEPYPSTVAQSEESPLVRAARIGLEARMHPRARIVIDSTTLVVSRVSGPPPTQAGAPASKEQQGRSWASGNSGDANAIAGQERSAREHTAAAEKSRVEGLRQEQSYMAAQEQEPYAEVLDDHVTKRLEAIPGEIKTKPPL